MVFLADKRARSCTRGSGELRRATGRRLELADPGELNFCWVTDFPVFEQDEETGELVPRATTRSPPRDRGPRALESDPASTRARAYDLILNGEELGGGSIRIHRQDVQARVFRALGIDDENGAGALRLLPRRAPLRHAAARGDRAGPRSLRDAAPRPGEHPGRDRVPEDRLRDLPDDRRAVPGGPGAARRSSGCASAPPEMRERRGPGPRPVDRRWGPANATGKTPCFGEARASRPAGGARALRSRPSAPRSEIPCPREPHHLFRPRFAFADCVTPAPPSPGFASAIERSSLRAAGSGRASPARAGRTIEIGIGPMAQPRQSSRPTRAPPSASRRPGTGKVKRNRPTIAT